MLKFFFSVFITVHSIILYLNFEKQAKNTFISILKVFIFYLALSCFVSYLILFNLKHHQISVIVFAIYFVSTFLIYRIDFKNFSKNLKNFFQRSKYSDFVILIYLLVAFFYISLPPIDIDSIRYHLLIGKKISLNEFYNNITLDYVYLSYSEIISYIGQIFYSNNIISLFNFFGLVIVYILNRDLKKNYNLGFGNHSTIIIFSILYLLSNLYSQKLYFLLCVLSVYSLIYVLIKNSKIDYIESLIFLSGNLFCFLGKYSFAVIITINIFFIFYKLSKQKKYYFFFSSVILFCILYFPIFLIKLRLFNEPFLPFIVINENNKFLSEFLKYTYNYGTNLNEIFNIEFYKNYFNHQNFISPSNLIGIAFITIFFSIKRNIFTLSLILYLDRKSVV